MGAPEETRTATGAAPSPAPSLTSIPLTIRLFGVMQVEQDGIALPRTRTAKEKWLLALLVLRRRESVDRAWLAGTLWPDSSDPQALGNLRRSLNNLRKVLGEHGVRLIAQTPRRIAMDISGAACDVIRFDAAIAQGDIASLREAVDLYRGPLLQDCDEEWVLPERTAREQQYLTALETLAAHAAEQNDLQEAIRCLRLVVTADPFRESAQRALLEALASSGDLSAVTLAYRQLRLRLHDELQTEPAPETTALYQQLRAAVRSRLTPVEEGCRDGARSSRLHVPRPISDLVGRTREINGVASLLGASSRLVTLTGSGGIGKTRLSIAVAEAAAAEFSCGLWFVDLAPLTNGTLVPQVVANRLGVREDPRRSLTEAVADFLAAKRALLILDNCEHLLGPCARFADLLLQTCPNLRILTTSRQPLGITGENVYHVSPLGLPAAEEQTSAIAHKIWEADSVRLFVERAKNASAAFLLTDRNAEAIAQVCRRLDGIPLAIELAAARIRALSVEQIASRLNDRFRLLVSGSATALPRHQTLRACTDWSYDLLTEPERALFRRLSVFAGGWTLDAAEVVCAGNGVEPDAILDLLSALIDKSLVDVEGGKGTEARYRLLETIREYAAQQRLLESGEATESRQRHLEYFLHLAEEGVDGAGATRASRFDRLEAEHDNLRAALEWSLEEPSGGQMSLRFVGALWPFWEARGHIAEGRQLTEAALAHPGTERQPTSARAKALLAAASLSAGQSDFGAGDVWSEESLAIYQELGDRAGQSAVLMDRGQRLLHSQGRTEPGRAEFERSLALRRELGDAHGVAECLNHLGRLAWQQGDTAEAQQLMQEALHLSRSVGNTGQAAFALTNLGQLAADRDDWNAARPLLEEAVSLNGVLKDKRHQAGNLQLLANEALAHGDLELARAAYEQGMALLLELNLNDKFRLSHLVMLSAHLLLEEGNFASARARYEEALVLRRQTSHRLLVDWSLLELGHAAWCQRDWNAARARTAEAAALFREYSHSDGLLAVLESLAGAAAGQGRAEQDHAAMTRAARVFGAAQCLRQSLSVTGPGFWRRSRARLLEAAREIMESEMYAGAREEGCAMGLEEAVAYALEETQSSRSM
jgi:predicted ATPase/DNA-binding SARP family transcriptional activator